MKLINPLSNTASGQRTVRQALENAQSKGLENEKNIADVKAAFATFQSQIPTHAARDKVLQWVAEVNAVLADELRVQYRGTQTWDGGRD